MKVLLANPRGFCAGVNMAIDVVDQVLEIKGAPLYVYHEIVHNLHVVNDFRARGVTFVDSIDEVPEGATVVYSAHGVSPAIRADAKRRRLTEIDATCPLVTKVHLEVLPLRQAGLHDRLHRSPQPRRGDRDRRRGAGVDRRGRERRGSRAAVRCPTPDKLAYVTQTTLSLATRRGSSRR
jgi:4-hydroxy-3-methylbut-2-enyl diphosphate reductase